MAQFQTICVLKNESGLGLLGKPF